MKRKLIESIFETSIDNCLIKPTASFDTFYKDCNKMSTKALLKWKASIMFARR